MAEPGKKVSGNTVNTHTFARLWDKADEVRSKARQQEALGLALYLCTLLFYSMTTEERNRTTNSDQIRAAVGALNDALAVL